MQERNDITSFDAILDDKYGAVGTAEREVFRKEATNYCVGNGMQKCMPTESGHCTSDTMDM